MLSGVNVSLTAPHASWIYTGGGYCLEGLRGMSYKAAPKPTPRVGTSRKGFPVHLLGVEASESFVCDVRSGP